MTQSAANEPDGKAPLRYAPDNSSGLPFGSDPNRSRAPLFLLGALYVVWLGVLLWMALFHSQGF